MRGNKIRPWAAALVLLIAIPCFAQDMPSGWNFNLTKRCAKTQGSPGSSFYYEDTAQCSDSRYWGLAVQSEKPGVGSCPGPVNRSFLINGFSSPIQLGWINHQSNLGPNWSVHLQTDLYNRWHDCGAGYFTWFAFMEADPASLPRPDKAKFTFTVNYYDFTATGSDASRGMIGFQGFWNGRPHLVEINTFTNWFDGHPDPAVYAYDPGTPGNLEYVQVNAAFYGLQFPKGLDTPMVVDFLSLFNDLIGRGLLESPAGGWANSNTQTIFLATETYNSTGGNSVITDIWFTDWRIWNKP